MFLNYINFLIVFFLPFINQLCFVFICLNELLMVIFVAELQSKLILLQTADAAALIELAADATISETWIRVFVSFMCRYVHVPWRHDCERMWWSCIVGLKTEVSLSWRAAEVTVWSWRFGTDQTCCHIPDPGRSFHWVWKTTCQKVSAPGLKVITVVVHAV